MYYVIQMQKLQADYYTGDKELSLCFSEFSANSHMVSEISTN